eukprot:COSAG06_NODE_5367_length_3523_cov_2.580315_4_plen_324_part_00
MSPGGPVGWSMLLNGGSSLDFDEPSDGGESANPPDVGAGRWASQGGFFDTPAGPYGFAALDIFNNQSNANSRGGADGMWGSLEAPSAMPRATPMMHALEAATLQAGKIAAPPSTNAFQVATSSGSGSASGSGSEGRSASDSASSTSTSTESDDSVDSGEEAWFQGKVSDADALQTYGSSNDAIKRAYMLARSELLPKTEKIPVMPEPAVPHSKSQQKDLRKLKRAAKAEATQKKKRFLATQEREHALGSYRLPTDSPAILLSAQAPHTIVDVNSEWCRWCCFSREDVLGESFKITHGAGTEAERVARIMAAMEVGVGCIAVLT